MLFALGAVSSALDALQSLTASKSPSAQTAGFNPGAANPFDADGDGGPGPTSNSTAGTAGYASISPQTMSALIAAQGQSSTGQTTSAPTSRFDALKDLFSQIDANGDGQITKSEFENALGAGGTNLAQADAVFVKLDANGDGTVSLNEMAKALMGGGSHHHHHLASGAGAPGGSGASGSTSGPGGSGSNSDPLLQALNGSSSSSVTNSDGSTTTTITYADGSKVSMTTPAASSASRSATLSYNWVEQMIQREAQALSTSTTASLSVSA